MQCRFENYYMFFAELEPQLLSLKVYGTDGEEALVKALSACLPNTTGLGCFLHKQRNIDEHLKTVSAAATSEIIRDARGGSAPQRISGS